MGHPFCGQQVAIKLNNAYHTLELLVQIIKNAAASTHCLEMISIFPVVKTI
jgi:hypothetical protein